MAAVSGEAEGGSASIDPAGPAGSAGSARSGTPAAPASTDDDLALEVQMLSSRLLEAEDGRSQLEEQVRTLSRELTGHKSENAEVVALRARIQELEDEMGDFSTQLLDEANNLVEKANRRAAASQKLVEERDVILETQQTQIDILKAMVEAAPPPPVALKEDEHDERTQDEETAMWIEYGSYSSAKRPLVRCDIRDFDEFCQLASTPRWKNTVFGRRTIAEDIVPTLRLDVAEHVSWLARRSWLQALLDGTLIVEPVSGTERVWASRPSHPCVLCGENRPQPQYRRLYQARVPGESQPFALGLECHARMRLSGDYATFLRSLADGVRRIDTIEQRQRCWEECLHLREQLFWSRAGGLYPPAAHTKVPPPLRIEEGSRHSSAPASPMPRDSQDSRERVGREPMSPRSPKPIAVPGSPGSSRSSPAPPASPASMLARQSSKSHRPTDSPTRSTRVPPPVVPHSSAWSPENIRAHEIGDSGLRTKLAEATEVTGKTSKAGEESVQEDERSYSREPSQAGVSSEGDRETPGEFVSAEESEAERE